MSAFRQIEPNEEITEAANIFAAAPGVTLIPVKIFNAEGQFADPTGGINSAVAQKPHVISGSWGYPFSTKMSWSDVRLQDPCMFYYLKTLEAAVARADLSRLNLCDRDLAKNSGPQ